MINYDYVQWTNDVINLIGFFLSFGLGASLNSLNVLICENY